MKTKEKQVIERILTLINNSETKDTPELSYYSKDHKMQSEYHKIKDLSLSELHVIDYIGSHDIVNATSIASGTHVTKGGISKITRRLMKKEFIESYFKSGNKKEKYYTLTGDGKEVYSIHQQLHEESMNRLTNLVTSFSEEELDTINKFLRGLDEV